MAILNQSGQNDKEDFFQKYKDCAAEAVLETIWQAKETNATELDIMRKDIQDLSPLKDLQNLQELDAYSTQVSDLSPLKSMIEKGIIVQWSRLNWEEIGIDIGDTPLSNPPIEIAKQGNRAILGYWAEKALI